MTLLSNLVDQGREYDLYSSIVNTEVPITAAITLTSTAFGKNHVISGASDYDIDLPAASGNSGKIIGFRITGSALFTIKGNGSELIDGENERVMWAGESAILLCDGSGWTKVAGKTVPYLGYFNSNTEQSLANSTWTIPIYQIFEENVANTLDTTDSTFTLPRNSNYNVIFEYSVSFGGSTGVMFSRYKKNGVEFNQSNNIHKGTTNSGLGGYITNYILSGRDYIKGDIWQPEIFQNSGASRNTYTTALNAIQVSITEIPTW